MQTGILFLSLFIFFSATSFAQKTSGPERKFSVSTSVASFTNIGSAAATNTPPGFKELDKKWSNYFLFEPNIYLGFKF
jgi:hypothetical protein